MKTVIRGDIWDVILKPQNPLTIDGGPCSGYCDYESFRIAATTGQSEIDLLDTLIHEYMHARYPMFTEDEIAECASELASMLDDLGFTREDHHE